MFKHDSLFSSQTGPKKKKRKPSVVILAAVDHLTRRTVVSIFSTWAQRRRVKSSARAKL